MKIKEIFQRIKKIKYIEIYIVVIISILSLVVYFVFKNTNDKDESIVESSASTDTLSGQLEKILSQMEGVGDCHVLITYYAKEIAQTSDTTTTNYTNSSYSSTVTTTTTTPVISTENGTSQVVCSDNTTIYGVVVVCDGGDDMKVVINIINAIKTLLNVNGLNIQVYKSY